jgi:hypothetical protein
MNNASIASPPFAIMIGLYACSLIAVGMALNLDKCEVVVFNDPGEPLRYSNTAWVLNGTPFKKSKEFLNLEVHFTGGRAWREGRMVPAWLNQRDKGQRALLAFIGKCHSAHPHTPYIISKLYDTLVSTVRGCGCGIWGPGAILTALESLGGISKTVFETSHELFMRRILHVGKKHAFHNAANIKSYSRADHLLRKGIELVEPGCKKWGRRPSMSVLRGRSEPARNMGTSTHTSCACSPVYPSFLC